MFSNLKTAFQNITSKDKNEDEYKIDGTWKKFEIKEVKIKVKIFLGIKINIKRKILWSDFGPVIKNKKGSFSFFSQSLNNIIAIEQWL